MKGLCQRTIFCILMVGATGTSIAADYAAMSKGSGVPESALKSYCKKIDCKYDKLKDTVQATASDAGGIGVLGGSESRTLQFTWVSGSSAMLVNIYDVINLYQDAWHFVESAEIYVGKEMLVKVSGSVDRQVGAYNTVAKKAEKVEVVSGVIPLDIAERVAAADPKQVTIRFYTKNGYVDKEGVRAHKLENVVLLAKAK